jgi:general secretion pathway protein H
MARRAHNRGMTVLELMIVLAIMGMLLVFARAGFRYVTRADLVENATELAAVMRRTSQLAVEHGELHRVVLDFEKDVSGTKVGAYVVEVCRGATAVQRNEVLKVTDEEARRAIERGRARLTNLPPDVLAIGDADEATKRAAAIAGHHVADRTCVPASDSFTGDANGKGWMRMLRAEKGIQLKEIWVQHRDDSVTKGQVAIYFFPTGSSEKAVIELTDGKEVFSVLVSGLTGRIELKDGELRDVNDHMMRNVMGDKDARREGQR